MDYKQDQLKAVREVLKRRLFDKSDYTFQLDRSRKAEIIVKEFSDGKAYVVKVDWKKSTFQIIARLLFFDV